MRCSLYSLHIGHTLNIILLSSDNYLYTGLKNLFPELLHINILSDNFIDGQKYVFLIDNRQSLKNLSKIYLKIKDNIRNVSCILLTMGRLNYHPLHTIKNQNDTKQSLEEIREKTIYVVKTFRPRNTKTVVFTVDPSLKLIIECTLSGATMQKMSEMFLLSQKALYKYRNELCKKMGYRNLFHACIHTFENNLLIEDIELPFDWIAS